jgi:hypothetical protein
VRPLIVRRLDNCWDDVAPPACGEHDRSTPWLGPAQLAARSGWQDRPVKRQRFDVTVATGGRGRLFVPVPFDPDQVWGIKREHHIAGTVNGLRVRAVIEPAGDGRGFMLGPAWRRDCGVSVGDEVTVAIEPEGPQRDDLAEDVAAALRANPEAGQFFDSLAQFYRRAYLRWIEATKRRPEQRAERIVEVVRLLSAGLKERP